jgi:hypothetical protein
MNQQIMQLFLDSGITSLIDRLGWVNVFTILASLYVIWESFNAVCNMPAGYRAFCHKAKYVLAISSSLAFIYYSGIEIPLYMEWLLFGSSCTMFMFVWPRMVYRVKLLLKELEEVVCI